MEPPPSSGGTISPTPTATATATAAATVTQPPPPPPPSSTQANYADSDFSPRSRNTDSWDEPPSFPGGQGGGKLRLMCSYGGHIVPRPHDKSLCYVGGDTRIMVVDRRTSLSDLSLRLSKTLLNDAAFLLKYQLPSEDLDSLISVTTDEDLENMIDEYDRISANSTAARASRLRLFLFPSKSEAVSSIGSLIESSTKSDDWFLNALNGATTTSTSTKVFSESSSVNCLLGLDDDIGNGNSAGKDAEAQLDGSFKPGRVNNNAKINGPDIQSVPDSPMVDTTSSFGSTSSSPSMANLQPIKVHVDENQRAGIEEQLSQMTVGGGARMEQQQKQQQEDGGFAALSSPPPPPLPAMVAGTAVSAVPAVVAGEYPNRVFSDDERSDHSAPVGHRKPPQTQQFQQQQPKASAPPDLPSPSDSVSSDSSITNPLSRQKHYIYQEPIVQIQAGNRVSGNPVEAKISEQNTRAPVPQDSGYVLQSQYDQHQQLHQQQQYVHAGEFIHHAPAGAVPITSYYPIYPSQQQHHPQHPALEHQYPFYFVQARPTQAYNLPVQQTSYSDSAPTPAPNRPQTPPQPTIVAPTSAYNPSRSIPASKPEMATGTYRTPTGTAPQLVQIAPGQHPQQYVGFSQIHHPSQSIAPTSAAATNYAYEFSDPAHAQLYYTQPLPPQMGAQHQTMTSVHPAEASSQFPVENFKQQIRTSQP